MKCLHSTRRCSPEGDISSAGVIPGINRSKSKVRLIKKTPAHSRSGIKGVNTFTYHRGIAPGGAMRAFHHHAGWGRSLEEPVLMQAGHV